ncbi:MAG TPA: APC family permease [Thermoanaerobaculia bacterium]|nr:APC family permease [Thermoanaerobaculia bacterium]
MPTTIKQILVGKARDPMDPRIFHTVTLAAFLAWVGLGADGLSSSAYGPEEAFKALGSHAYLAVFLALLTAITVCVISLAYTKVIELFPAGGGGYLVATKLLGPRLGVVSGCALVVDYVLTISISIASGCDQLFSLLSPSAQNLKFTTEVVVTLALIVLNLRGIKESITVLVPIFLLFLLTHFSLIAVTMFGHLPELPRVFGEASNDATATGAALGWAPLLLIMMRAYSLGGGTYTGIEAVSNSVQLLREPRVPNAKRTMLYMAVSLAFTAGGIIIGYLLVGARPHPGRTMNAVYAERVFGDWVIGGLRIGPVLVALTLISAGALLFVAAQTGFVAGPRVLANMAVDSWVPRRFAQLSDRLVTNNGFWLMGLAAFGTLLYTRGAVSRLVVMYSINVFLTFTLTLLGMLRYWLRNRGAEDFKRNLAIHGGGLVLCSLILCVTVYEKFGEGGWLTVVVTASFVTLAFLIRRHYARIRDVMRRIDETLLDVPVRAHEPVDAAIPRDEPVAVILVSGFSGMGVHTVLSVQNLFPHQFKSYVFVSVGIIDSENFKGAAEIEALKKQTEEDLQKYVAFAQRLGFAADYRYDVGTEAVEEVVTLCEGVRKDYPRSIFFLGQLVFENDRFYYRFLHNETAFAIQRRLQFAGLQAVVLPIRVLDRVTRGKKARAA